MLSHGWPLNADSWQAQALFLAGNGYRVVPFAVGAEASATRIKDARLLVYPGAPHGITDTHKQQLGTDLLAFVEEYTA